MKKTAFVVRTLLIVLTCIIGFSSRTWGQIQIGTGPDSSFLVIEATDFGTNPLVFQWNYTYNASTPYTTADMLTAVDTLSTLDLNFTILYSGTFLDAIEYQGITLTNEFIPPYSPFWAQWVSGGTSGSPLVAMPSGTWSAGYGITNRELAPGSWDGFIFNGEYDSNPPYAVISAPPSIVPVPEPSTLALIALATISLLLYGRKRFHTC